MKIILLASAFLIACSSDNVTPVDGGGDVQTGMDATMMMDSTTMMDTGQDTSMSSDAPNDSPGSKDAPSDAPSDALMTDVVVAHCVNNQKDADETDVDCGGNSC